MRCLRLTKCAEITASDEIDRAPGIHSPRQSCATSHRLAPSWSMRTMPSIAKSDGKMYPTACTGFGIASRGQAKPVRKNCGRLVAEEDERRRLRTLEPGARRLAHEAGRENEHRREREQLQRIAERGKAVDARQHDEDRARARADRWSGGRCRARARSRTRCPPPAPPRGRSASRRRSAASAAGSARRPPARCSSRSRRPD